MTSLHRVCSLFLHSCSATDALVWVHLYHPRRSFSASSFPNVLVRRIESKVSTNSHVRIEDWASLANSRTQKASLRKSYAPHKETSVHQDKPKIMAPQRNRRRDQREGDQWQRPRQNYGDVRYGRTDYAPQQTAYNSTAYHDAYDYNYGPAAVRRYRQNEHGVHTYFDDHEVYTSGHTSYQQMGMVPQNRNQYYHPRTPDASSYRPNAMPWA